MKESELQLYILRYLKAKGYYFGRVNTMGRQIKGVYIRNPYTLLGVPDIMGFYTKKVIGSPFVMTRMFGIEVKSGTGKQTPAQKEFQQYLEASGGLYILARKPENVEEIL